MINETKSQTEPEPPIIEFRKASTIIKDHKILDSITLTIQDGENVAIIGPNGSGKSTLIKLITRDYYPYPGPVDPAVKIFGESIWNIFKLRNLLGIVSADLQEICSKWMDGREVILSGFFGGIGLYGQVITPEMEKKTQDVLEFLGVPYLAHKSMKEMSSGEARRILIGRALVHDPKALILDEPTNSLDIHAARKFRDMMRKITRAGKSIILVTHNLADIIPEISRVILIKEGTIYKDGPKEEILTEENLSTLFDMPVKLKKVNDCYYLWG